MSNGRPLRIILCVSLISLCGCKDTMNIEKIENVQRVFMHKPDDYSVMYQDGQYLKVARFSGQCGGSITLISDVPKDKPMWVEWRGIKNPNGRIREFSCAIIHVTSADIIGGAGWDNGKFGSGQTAVIK